MKKLILLSIVLVNQLGFCQTITLAQTLDNTIQQGTVICSAEQITDNNYIRAFDINTLGYDQFNVVSVDFGVYSVNNEDDNYVVDVVIYQTDTFPEGSLMEVTRVSVPVSNADNGTLKHVPLNALVTDNFLVFAVSAQNISIPGNLNRIIIGSNSSGQTAPSYYQSTSCGYDIPNDIANLFPPPEIHLVMQVTGSPRLSLPEKQDELISVYPNPTNDIINVKLLNSDSIEKVRIYSVTGKLLCEGKESIINLSNFSKGLYLLKVETVSGKSTVKRIEKL